MGRIKIKQKSNSFFTAGILMIVLVITWFLHQGLNRFGLPDGLAGLLNADFENFRNLEQFSEEKSEEVQKLIAGFWLFSEGDEEADPIAKREYLEIIDNGIIWHVKKWYLNDPAGGRHVITNIVHGFVKPYSYSQDGGVYIAETRIIRQAFIANRDTCYGASHEDGIWQINISNDILTVNQREYVPYRGELTEFFPDGNQLDLVDKITLRRCAAATDLSRLAKELLAGSFVALPASARVQSVESLIQTYYKPIVFDELVRRYDPRAVPDEMNLQFTLTGGGAVANLRNRSAALVTKRFDDMVVPDIEGWLFPPCADQGESRRIDLTVRVR